VSAGWRLDEGLHSAINMADPEPVVTCFFAAVLDRENLCMARRLHHAAKTDFVYERNKSMCARFVLVFGCLGLLVAGCGEKRTTTTERTTTTTNNADDVAAKARQERREAVDATAEQLKLEKEQLERNLEEGLNQLDQKMATLSERINEAQGDAKARLQKEWEELKPQREQARLRLDELKKSSAEAWQDVKAGAQSAFAELRESVNQASERFEKENADK
jgi:TolA-binding protein